jgi:hypothetical protein
MPLPPTRSQGVSRLLTELNTTRLSLTGEEASGERRARLLGQVAEYALVSLIVLVIAGIEVGRWYFQTPPQPVWVCGFAACLIGYAAVRVWFILPQLRTLAREREARRNLKAALNQLCARGYVLFEGLTGPRGWRLGSVVAGPTGVFCLVSRYVPRGKNLSEKVEHLDNATLRIAGREVMADPLDQARRAAAGLYEMLAAEGLDTVPVQPMVIFPGWTVERPETFIDPEVIVTGEQSLEAEIRQGDVRMEPKDLIAVSLLLEKAARTPRLPDYVAA